ncbi:MAG TPA: phosphoribosyl-ATP diphosphatase [Candidatus Binatia bacterium]|nr:phosphoribosyl-ATP diphosphatase [Candidatus Binatia bacterium]
MDFLAELYDTLRARRTADPNGSYVAGLYARGEDAILKKIGEEAAETLIAAKNGDRAQLVHELADLWFHTLVLMAARDVPPAALCDELARRRGTSGLAEKAARAPVAGQR